MAISSEDAESGREWKEELGLPFPLLVDDDLSVIRAYGVYHEKESKGREIARPSTFVLDAAGRVAWCHVGARASDRPKPEEVLARVDRVG